MPICTAVLAAALLSGPAAAPPDPAPGVPKAVAKKIEKSSPSEPQQPLAVLQPGGAASMGMPGMGGEPVAAPIVLPPAAFEDRPGDTAGMGTGDTAGDRAATKAGDTTGDKVVDKTGGKTGDKAGDTAAGKQDDDLAIPMINPKTHDLLIKPAVSNGAPGQPIKTFTLNPFQGVQVAQSYPGFGRPGHHTVPRGPKHPKATDHPRTQGSAGAAALHSLTSSAGQVANAPAHTRDSAGAQRPKAPAHTQQTGQQTAQHLPQQAPAVVRHPKSPVQGQQTSRHLPQQAPAAVHPKSPVHAQQAPLLPRQVPAPVSQVAPPLRP
ncbi:hypothetical protein [Microbispora sp. ATCC PTA-5024]|uniref:hypothetical protein n=1 Tax=Microbispora sp. ATCC PTA-5024 TaxID=316330 RepID=UPI0003DD74DC|nr:hypothetical protein [Microbispora sp. ATCC PTA-5024]ETK30495.1 hypothetical protein MPTA5024_39955 [Microbispora sp. ATCC PTA-5024]